MIGHFVYNLYSYSGAAFQALELASINRKRKSVIFNIGGSLKFKISNQKGIIVFDLPKSYFKRLYYIIILSIVLKIRVFHLHGFIMTGILPGIILRKKLLLKSTLLDEDDLITLSKKGLIYKLFLKRLDGVISISSPIQEINENYISQCNIDIIHKFIPNGVEIPELFEKDYNLFIIVGVVTPRKKTLNAIEFYINNFSDNILNKLLIIGPLPNEIELAENDSGYFDKCQKRIIGYEDQIKFTGLLNKSKLNEIYKKSFAIIHFSEKEGMPNCILEAISFNCVPITTSINGIAYDIIQNGIDGIIIHDYHEKVPYNSLLHISNSKAPFLKAKNKFDFKLLINKHEENYNLLLNN